MFLGDCRIAGQVKKRDRRRLLGRQRSDPALLHVLLGDRDDICEDRVFAVPPLEPGDDGSDELGVAGRLPVHECVLLLVRKAVESGDPVPHGPVEELQPRADQPLHAAAVEPREARELLVGSEVEPAHDQPQKLGVLVTNAVVSQRREPDLEAEAPQELRRATQLLGEFLEGRGACGQFGHEQSERERQLTSGDPAGHVVERDARLLKCVHEPHQMNRRRVVRPLLANEQPELFEPANVVERTRDEVGEFLR